MEELKSKKRSARRHEIERVKHKRYKYWYNKHRVLDEVAIGKMAHTGTPCSCFMCGNPRKHFHTRTIAELSFDEIEKMERALIETNESNN